MFRVHKKDLESQKKYLDFLRNLLKDQSYVALAYMTGILPIKKYGEHSALNMFTEISMTDPRECAEFTGFIENEVQALCEHYNMPFDETKRWYDGYNLMGISIYNPRSVVMSMTGGYFNNYWTSTETYALLDATLQGNEEVVDEIIEQVHQDNTSILQYNDENSLSCVLSLAYYSAQKSHTITKEAPAGKGYADLVFAPRRTSHLPAFIVELKYDHSAEEAVEQIRKKDYTDCLKDYSGEILLVGINYDRKSKEHICKIERC